MKIKTDPIRKYWLSLSTIQGYIAMWAVRQSPYHCPDDLDVVIKTFRCRCQHWFDQHDMAQFDRMGLLRLLQTFLMDIPEFEKWNERKNGNKAPYQFISAHTPLPDPDDDFIDLGALAGNVVRDVMRECERDNDFDRRFERDWKWGAPKRWLQGLYYKLFPPTAAVPQTAPGTSQGLVDSSPGHTSPESKSDNP